MLLSPLTRLADARAQRGQHEQARANPTVQQFSQQTVQKASDRFDPRPDVDGLQLGPRSEEEEDDDDDDGALRPQEGGRWKHQEQAAAWRSTVP